MQTVLSGGDVIKIDIESSQCRHIDNPSINGHVRLYYKGELVRSYWQTKGDEKRQQTSEISLAKGMVQQRLINSEM